MEHQEQSSSWIPFEDWLAEQRRGRYGDQADSLADGLDASISASSSRGDDTAPSTSQSTHNVPRAPASSSAARDCRYETRLVDGSVRARQEMTIMLSAPGVPSHKASLVTGKQAAALMTALCEPLVQIRTGRLTRRMETPTKLQPTGEVGVLSLWLLPNNDLSLVWQAQEEAGPQSGQETDSRSAEMDCNVTLWEEIVRFPAGTVPTTDDPLVVIHMLRGDASARSFYIRPREDVMAAHLAAGMGPAQANNSEAAAANLKSRSSSNGSHSADEQQQQNAPRMYFWVAEPSLPDGVHNLGRLKSLLKRPPTLAKRSGIPERQLAEITSWLQSLEVGPGYSVPPPPPQANEFPPVSAPVLVDDLGLSSLSNSNSTGSAGHFLPVTVDDLQIQPSSSRLAHITQPTIVRSNHALATSTVSATAAAVYQDSRFNVAYPCIISVAVSVSLRAAPGEQQASLTAEAAARAKALAENAARRAVDRTGRQRIEEQVCESLICTMRAQRAKAKAEKQHRRDYLQRKQQAAEAQPLIKKAVRHAAAFAGASPRKASAAQMPLSHQVPGSSTIASIEIDSPWNSMSSTVSLGDRGDTSMSLNTMSTHSEVQSHGNSRVSMEELQGLMNNAHLEPNTSRDRRVAGKVTVNDLSKLMRDGK